MKRIIESNFPTINLDPVAEKESWRKEVFRPNYHIHKWWANRLGSVFRAIIIGSLTKVGDGDIWDKFYSFNDFHDKIVLDPFMGSGTTIGEAIKLGAKAVGCDINPVSTFLVNQGLSRVEIRPLKKEFNSIFHDVYKEIHQLYQTIDPETGETINALYYFWVKELETPTGEKVPLFNSYVFSKNAYPKRKPEAKILCPNCGEIINGTYNSELEICSSCCREFNPQQGPVSGSYVVDNTGKKYKIKDLVQSHKTPPKHKLYAILAVNSCGKKIYLKPTAYDFEKLKEASEKLAASDLPLPTMKVRNGHNTNQAKNYNYNYWRDFFLDRQLFSLGTLLKRILSINDKATRDHFICLFSSTLEFNNLFCSFKGEGTGAVRHMFSHHILKPEKTPLENTVLGLEKASGTFSSLFKSRLLKAQEYLDNPFEILIDKDQTTQKVTYSKPIQPKLCSTWGDFIKDNPSALIVNGDSSRLQIPDKSIDAVVTDPPYFDFIHYSELSDFFYSWLSVSLAGEYSYFDHQHCGLPGEVQDKCGDSFSRNLARVFEECHRVLKDCGILTFSFHHSRPEGWVAIYKAIESSGFDIVAAHPLKAEMSVGSPKTATKEPINLDAILVCKKHHPYQNGYIGIWEQSCYKSKEIAHTLTEAGRHLSSGDLKVILASQIISIASQVKPAMEDVEELLKRAFKLEIAIEFSLTKKNDK